MDPNALQPAVVFKALTLDVFQKAVGCTEDVAKAWCDVTNSAMLEFGILKPLDQAMFLAQVGHESTGFTQLVESFNYSIPGLRLTFGHRLTETEIQSWGRQANERSVPVERQKLIANKVYGGRMGNTRPNDGWDYRGRGPIQTTGTYNYKGTGDALGIDLYSNPDLLTTPAVGIRAAAYYYVKEGCLKFTDDIVRITKIINNGDNGIDDRRKRYVRAKSVIV